MSEAKVVCVGEALVVLIQSVGGPLETAEHFDRGVGGAEFNVAIALAAQGIPSSLLTRVGADGFGRHIVDEARRHGVDVSTVAVDPFRATGMYVKEIGGTTGLPGDLGEGRSRMLYYRAHSAGSALSPSTLAAAASTLAAASLIHLSGITPALSDSARSMSLELARSRPAGKLLSFDINWRPQLWLQREDEGVATLTEIAGLADLVFLGASEAEVLFGTSDPAAVRRMLPNPRWIVLKNDGSAAVGFDGARRVELAPAQVEPREAIGAGDAFAAGFIAALVRESTLDECLENAHRVAALALASTADHVGLAP